MKQRAFTLIELLVVIAIIGILATVVLTSLGSARERARDARRQSDIRTIQQALEVYYLDNGQYPIRNWTFSSSNWNILETMMGVDLPEDPVNESTYPYMGGTSYGYYAGNQYNYLDCPLGQFYLLVYNPEGPTDPEDNVGVTRCDDGTQRTFGNGSITVGVSPAN